MKRRRPTRHARPPERTNERTLKILHVSSARAHGGGERHLADLARGLARRGHEVYAALREDSPLRAELLSSLPPQNIFTLPLKGALDLPSALKLARLAREHEIDILHAHLARDYPPAALAARRAPPRDSSSRATSCSR